MTYNYFETIDTPNKAYFLGLFHADGSISRRQQTKNYEEIAFKISLQERDKDILLAFCNEVALPQSRVKIYSSKRPTESKLAVINISAKAFTTHLQDLKFETLTQRIPTELVSHFIRGFFDGDGCVFVRRSSKRVFY